MAWIGSSLHVLGVCAFLGCGPELGGLPASGSGGGSHGDSSSDSGADASSSTGADVVSHVLVAESDSTCIARPELTCWGDNDTGQLGIDGGDIVDHPVALPFAPTSVALSWSASCLLQDGTVRCVGLNYDNRLVAGAEQWLTTHTEVPFDMHDIVQITLGFYHYCALRADGRVLCWGNDNQVGSLGESIEETDRPTLVPGLENVVAISAGDSDHTCAVLQQGLVTCWGGNDYGQRGGDPLAPIEGLSGIVDVRVGSNSSCALHEDGRVSCWGRASEGQLGVPNDDPTLDTCHLVTDGACARTPRVVPGIDSARAMDYSGGGGCAITDDGITCWGNIATVDIVGDVLAVAVGDVHACALSSEGLFCWGEGLEGQLGDGTRTSSATPVRVR